MPTSEEVAKMVAEVQQETNPEPAPEPEPPKEPEKQAEKEPEPEPKKEPEPEKKSARRPEYIPAAKFHEVRHELQAMKQAKEELESRLKAAEKPETVDSVDGVSKVAEKYGLDPQVVSDIVSLAASPVKEIKEKLTVLESERAKVADALRYSSDEEKVLSSFPDLKPYAADLKKMAYSEGNESVPLEYLALKLRHDLNLAESVAPAEGASAPPTGKAKDFSNLTEEEFAKLTPSELDKYISLNRVKR